MSTCRLIGAAGLALGLEYPLTRAWLCARPHGGCRSLCRLLQRLTVRRREGFHEGVRQMIRGHLDEIAVEAREQLPVLRLVGGARLDAPRGALEARFELGRIESIEKFDECGARRLSHGVLVEACRGHG